MRVFVQAIGLCLCVWGVFVLHCILFRLVAIYIHIYVACFVCLCLVSVCGFVCYTRLTPTIIAATTNTTTAARLCVTASLRTTTTTTR